MQESVFSIIRKVLSEATEKTAAAKVASHPTPGIEKAAQAPVTEESETFSKIAEACDFLADNLHVVVDDRSPQEKLAELAATQDALRKMAEENDPPMSPSLDSGIAPGGSSSAMKAEPSSDGGGGESLQPGESGQALPAFVPPKVTEPTEKANPQDAANAMVTNQEMMLPDQPEDILKQAMAINEEYVVALDQAVRNGEITKEAAIGHLYEELSALQKVAAEEEMINPGWTDGQQGMMRAMRAKPTGLGQFMADPDLATKRLTHGAVGGLGGAGGGALAGLLASALTKGKIRPGAGAMVGAAGGGALGLTGGAIHGENDYLKGKGVHQKLLGLGGASFTPEAAKRYGVVDPKKEAAAANLLAKAAASGTPRDLALTMIRAQGDEVISKIAEDALFPAHISAGTEPLLQSAPGVPSALNQGSEPGEDTPRETAPTTSQGAGREALGSNEAAINFTKRQAKAPQKGALAEVLTEPAMSSAHDSVLQKSLDNTSSAGVKISAAKELLRKFAGQSGENAKLVQTLSKMAEEGELEESAPAADAAMPPEAGMPGAMPPEGMPNVAEEAPPEEALQAAAAGITPEMLEQATVLLQSQGAEAAQADEMAAQQAAAQQPDPAAMPPEGAAPDAAQAGMMPADAAPPPSAQGAM